MSKNTHTDINGQVAHQEAVLSLLTAIVTRAGHSLSWYTSKKGRVWITLKGFSPTPYTTSGETVPNATDEQALDTFEVLIAAHVRKLWEIEPPLTTWHTSQAIVQASNDAHDFVQALYGRWLAGEQLWTPDEPIAPGAGISGTEPEGPHIEG